MQNPIKNRVRLWVLHPKYVGKVVAKGHAGVNRKSRCVDSANEVCKEGQQMISIVRSFYKNIPVMYDANCRFPPTIQYLDEVEGMSSKQVLWCSCHLIEIPPLDQVTRLLSEVILPESKDSPSSDSDFEDSRKKSDAKSNAVVQKNSRRGRPLTSIVPGVTVSKTTTRSVRRD